MDDQEIQQLKKVGHYEILTPLGGSRSHQVFKAFDPDRKRLVAVKLCTAEDPKLRRRFLDLARAAGRLEHSTVVEILEVSRQPDEAYLVEEFLSGGDLLGKLPQMQGPSFLGLELLQQIASALSHAHANGVLHRALGPHRVRVLIDDRCKVIDFGIGGLLQDFCGQIPELGENSWVSYAAPEEIREQDCDVRSDIFSFSALTYHVLSGRPAFSAATSDEVVSKILEPDPAPLTELWADAPTDLAELVHSGLAADPEERPADLQGFTAALESARRAFEEETATVVVPEADVDAESKPTSDDDSAGDLGAAPASKSAETPAPPAADAAKAETAVASDDQTSGRRFRRLGLAVLLILIAIVAVIALLVSLGDDADEQSDVADPLTELAVPVAAMVPSPSTDRSSSILVDALPWGEVRRIVGDQGLEFDLPTEATTPLELSLPPGSYEISLSHPDQPDEASCQVEILAGEIGRCRVVLIPTSPVQYFLESGWWR